ncbi:MAG: glycosyltransferase family 2 protein [Planctomycetes bacterium]|nr:glycosyltransferase family 2 protein [Planctomycetota bacterium]
MTCATVLPATGSGLEKRTGESRLLSVIVPAYNEARTLGTLLQRLRGLPVPQLEVLVVDDGSDDGTLAIAQGFAAADPRVRVLRHPCNRGKGAAIRTALRAVRGGIAVVQDADLENDPSDLLRMLRLFDRPGVSAVYGSRWLDPHGHAFSASCLAAALLSWLANVLYGCRLTDLPTCYKMFRTDLLRVLALESEGFDFCPEVTAKALLAGHEIHEVPISYRPRTRSEGKKIRWRDGLRALWTLTRLRFASSARVRAAPLRRARTELSHLGARGVRA